MAFDFAVCLVSARQLLVQQPSDDSLLQFLRGQGATMLDSVKLMRELRSLPLGEAQDIVHNSTVWADHYESHQRLQEDFAKALLEIGGKLEEV